MSSQVERLLGEALQQLQASDLGRAERSVRRALGLAPRHPGALQVAGAVFSAMGRSDLAIEQFRAAALVAPGDPQAGYNLARALADSMQYELALEAFERAVRLAPGDPEVAFGRGCVLLELHRYRDALAVFDEVLARAPGVAAVWFNRGNAYMALGDVPAAIESYEGALALEPDAAPLHVNHGAALRRLGRTDEALAALDRAVQLAPQAVEAWSNRAEALHDLGRTTEALASFERAIALAPQDASVWNNRGVVLRDSGRQEEALDSFERAIQIDPARADLWSNRGNALGACGRARDALASYERALELSPAFADAWRHRGAALVALDRRDEAIACFDRALELDPSDARSWAARAEACVSARRFDEAARNFEAALTRDARAAYAAGGLLQAKLMGCDWEGLDRIEAAISAGLAKGDPVALPFQAAAMPLSRSLQRRCAELVTERLQTGVQASVHRAASEPGKPIRIGYLSPDFREHPVGFQVLALLEHHDRSRFAPLGLSIGPARDDPYQGRMRQGFDRFVELHGCSTSEALSTLRELDLDLVVDLTGHMEGHRMDILAQRPAPVQASLFCPTTSGAPWIDYLVTDRQVVPPAHAEGYSEQLAIVPVSYFVTHHGEIPVLPGATRAEEGLPDEGCVFSSFCESYKIRPDVWGTWMRLLLQVPGSVLWLAIRNNDAARDRLRARAAEAGIDPGRLVFSRVVRDRQAHLSRLVVADLCLDTPVYNGHTTTADALWAGVPVVTCPGESFSGRIASSLVHAAGLPELVCDSLHGYEDLALALARDPERRRELRNRLSANRASHPLFDAASCVRHIESAFATMVDRQRRGLSPASFEIEG